MKSIMVVLLLTMIAYTNTIYMDGIDCKCDSIVVTQDTSNNVVFIHEFPYKNNLINGVVKHSNDQTDTRLYQSYINGHRSSNKYRHFNKKYDKHIRVLDHNGAILLYPNKRKQVLFSYRGLYNQFDRWLYDIIYTDSIVSTNYNSQGQLESEISVFAEDHNQNLIVFYEYDENGYIRIESINVSVVNMPLFYKTIKFRYIRNSRIYNTYTIYDYATCKTITYAFDGSVEKILKINTPASQVCPE